MSLHEIPEFHDKTQVYEDRQHAGQVLAGLLRGYQGSDALVLAIPTRGIPIAAALARSLGLPLDVAVVSKITFPWNPEAGYGAVAFDGTVNLHQGLIDDMGLIEPEISKGTRLTRDTVEDLAKLLRGERPFPDLNGRTVLLADEGVASSMTMETAIQALKQSGASSIIVAVTTGYETSLQRVARQVEEVYCPNVRGGWGYEVAQAYLQWAEVTDSEAERIIAEFTA
jgi:putative phosphoribosyl transferase